jgi:hypothetical protein
MAGLPECDKALERLLPRIGPPSVAECDSMACSDYAAGDKTQQVGPYLMPYYPAALARAGNASGIIPCSDLPQTSNNIIQKGLAFVRE